MNENILDRKLLIYFVTRTDKEGKNIIPTKTISNVRLDATEEELEIFF